MQNKKLRLIFMLIVAFVIGVIFSTLFQGLANAYGELPGPWTVSEKRQIIESLAQIEKNTRIYSEE